MTSDQDRDLELVRRARTGDEEAFEFLMQDYRSRVFRLALRFTSCPSEAEEVSQEVFLAVFRKLDGFEGKSAFSTWLYRVTVNAALMRIRSETRAELIALDDLDPDYIGDDTEPAPGPDDRLISEQSLALIEKAMERMAPDLKTVFVLRDIEGFSNEETAEIMDLTVPAIKSRLHRARAWLRPRLKDLFTDAVEG